MFVFVGGRHLRLYKIMLQDLWAMAYKCVLIVEHCMRSDVRTQKWNTELASRTNCGEEKASLTLQGYLTYLRSMSLYF